jgi:hypothetical protein
MRTAVLVALIVGGYLVFEFGRIRADYNIVDSIEQQRIYTKQIADLEVEISTLKQEIALLQTHEDIDREAYQLVEANLTSLQTKIQEQGDAIAFYRGIISPKDGGRGALRPPAWNRPAHCLPRSQRATKPTPLPAE